ncbi:MAG: cell wall-binding repeat-containing protein [Coriobacteriales bacterium]
MVFALVPSQALASETDESTTTTETTSEETVETTESTDTTSEDSTESTDTTVVESTDSEETVDAEAELLQTDTAETGTSSSISTMSTSANTSAELAEFESAIVDGLENMDSKIDVSSLGIVFDSSALAAYSDAINSNPDLFYVSSSYSFTVSKQSDGTKIFKSISPKYLYSASTVATMKTKYESAMNNLLSWVPANASDAEKVKAVHDWLVRNCAYNESAAESGYSTSNANPWTAYGALVDKTPVCQGYTLAFIAAMNRLGITSDYVTQRIGSSGHAWNRVYVDSSWFNVDVTFDDPLTDKGFNHTPNTTYFLKSDSWFMSHSVSGFHGSSPSWVPSGKASTSTKYDSKTNWTTYKSAASNSVLKSSSSTTSTVSLESLGWERISGSNRYETSSEVAASGFTSATTVVIASGANFPDALSASAFAGTLDAPVLLTESDTLSSETLDEIKSLGATEAYIIGGTSAISSSTEAELEAMDLSVTRISGSNRLETSLNIYEEGEGNWGDTAIVASGTTFADALSVSSLSYAEGYPIFLTDSEGNLSDEAAKAIANGNFDTVLLVGGTARVSDNVKTQIGSDVTYTRLSGSNRYETSVAIAEYSVNDSSSISYENGVMVATGSNFPDALAGGAVAGETGRVLILVDDTTSGTCCESDILEANADEISAGYVLGGTASISDSLAVELAESAN